MSDLISELKDMVTRHNTLHQDRSRVFAEAADALAAKDATIAGLREALEWQPLETAPKNPKGDVWGPEILLCTKHGKVEYVIIARYVAGHHHAWLDTNPDSCVSARLGDDAVWMPKPLGRAALEASRARP